MTEENAPTLEPLDKWRESRLAGYTNFLLVLVLPLYRFFDRLFHSRYNPLYKSGVLACWLLFLVIISGIYLLLFYQVSQPYQSVAGIQQQVWLGSWIRALHRYASGAALVAVIFHTIQLLLQGRTWGPRVLAWLSGVVLVAAIFVSAWSGYVMVWDQHGQLLAIAGAKLLQLLPILRETLAQAFDGSLPVSSSFFFMNLFLHVAVPLAMVILLWIHTAKLARNAWVPEVWTRWQTLGAFFLLSILWPAPLTQEANLLRIVERIPVDIFFGFWLPFLNQQVWLVVLGTVFIALLSLVPWWWRPKKLPATSTVQSDLCDGCQQCIRDCPYQAISMDYSGGSRLGLAVVDAKSCVSCGVCGASCHSHAVGLPGLKGKDQVASVELRLANLDDSATKKVALVFCASNYEATKTLEHLLNDNHALYPVSLLCSGTMHMDVVEILLDKFAGVFIWGCPERCCHSRDGAVLLRERVSHKRAPSLPRSIANSRVAFWNGAASEFAELSKQLGLFQQTLVAKNIVNALPFKFWIGSIFGTVISLSLVAYLAQYPLGQQVGIGILRVAVRLPGQELIQCRELSPQEKAIQPAHMQLKQICEKKNVDYILKVSVNNQETLVQTFVHGGFRADRPVIIHRDLELLPGEYEVNAAIHPKELSNSKQINLIFNQKVKIERAEIRLLTLGEQAQLVLK